MASLFCKLTNVTMHVFAREGGKFELLYCKYECVVQRVANLICKLTNVTMHVLPCICQSGVAILNCYSVNINVLSRGGGKFVL